jgi:hypothetical protein
MRNIGAPEASEAICERRGKCGLLRRWKTINGSQ